jgi:hypothetical protein
MLKYVSKFAMDILPSVAATIIGAYIVNHYIAAKPAADAPAAAVSASGPKAADAKNSAKTAVKAPETSADVAKIPEAGVKAKGISEKGLLEKTAAEKPVMPEKPAEKAADKPAETASIPVETRRHQPALREKAVAKTAAPAVAAPTAVPPIEAAAVPEERRDANELARAAIERLRGAGDGSPRAPEAARIPDAPRIASTPVSTPPLTTNPVRPLPPPVVVSAPGSEAFDSSPGSSQIRPPYLGAAGETSDLHRPTPPAEIPQGPVSRPLDLRAEAAVPTPREHTSVAEDMLSAAKSVFHAVLPK